MLPEIIFKKVAGINCWKQKELEAINVAMNSFEWEQYVHKILAFAVCSPKFPKNTSN